MFARSVKRRRSAALRETVFMIAALGLALTVLSPPAKANGGANDGANRPAERHWGV